MPLTSIGVGRTVRKRKIGTELTVRFDAKYSLIEKCKSFFVSDLDNTEVWTLLLWIFGTPANVEI